MPIHNDALRGIFALTSDEAAVLAGIGPRRLRAGGPANLVVLDAPDPVTALRGICRPLEGWRAGRRSFRNPPTELCRPTPP